MSTGTDARIADGLLIHLEDLDYAPADGVAHPNLNFTSASGKYLRATILRAETFARSLPSDGIQTHAGILQVDVMWPSGAGAIPPLELAAKIRDHFKRGTVLFQDGLRITVTGAPSVGASIQEPESLMIPVSIPWRCHVRPTSG